MNAAIPGATANQTAASKTGSVQFGAFNAQSVGGSNGLSWTVVGVAAGIVAGDRVVSVAV